MQQLQLDSSPQLLTFPYSIVLEIFSFIGMQVRLANNQPFRELTGRFKRDPSRTRYLLFRTCDVKGRWGGGCIWSPEYASRKQKEQPKVSADLLLFLSNVRNMTLDRDVLWMFIQVYSKYPNLQIRLEKIILCRYDEGIRMPKTSPDSAGDLMQFKCNREPEHDSHVFKKSRVEQVFRAIGGKLYEVLDLWYRDLLRNRVQPDKIGILRYANTINRCSTRVFFALDSTQRQSVRELIHVFDPANSSDHTVVNAVCQHMERCPNNITHLELEEGMELHATAMYQLVDSCGKSKSLRYFTMRKDVDASEFWDFKLLKAAHLFKLPNTLKSLAILVTAKQFSADAIIHGMPNLDKLEAAIWVKGPDAAMDLEAKMQELGKFFGKKLKTKIGMYTPFMDTVEYRKYVNESMANCKRTLTNLTTLLQFEYDPLDESEDESSDEEMS